RIFKSDWSSVVCSSDLSWPWLHLPDRGSRDHHAGDTATMNAERDGVVITRPAVWEMKPTATSVPNSRPPASSERSGVGRKRVPGASARAAMPNRTAMKANGVASASALLTATKLVPHRNVAASSARSTWPRVTREPADRQPWGARAAAQWL